jgi:hypothetical protein
MELQSQTLNEGFASYFYAKIMFIVAFWRATYPLHIS